MGSFLQVDGFRFDIMGHMMESTMRKVQAALAALKEDTHGVDGAGLYLYGEAWDFGEVAMNQVRSLALELCCKLAASERVVRRSFLMFSNVCGCGLSKTTPEHH